MLAKIIKLEDIKDDFDNTDNSLDDRRVIRDFMQFTIKAFKTITDEVTRLGGKVKRLEQQITYYPFTEEELLKEKIGGTD